MKIVSLRSLSRDAPTLTSSVLVTHQNVIIGTYRPIDAPPEISEVKLLEVSLVEDTPENRAAGSHPITVRKP